MLEHSTGAATKPRLGETPPPWGPEVTAMRTGTWQRYIKEELQRQWGKQSTSFPCSNH